MKWRSSSSRTSLPIKVVVLACIFAQFMNLGEAVVSLNATSSDVSEVNEASRVKTNDNATNSVDLSVEHSKNATEIVTGGEDVKQSQGGDPSELQPGRPDEQAEKDKLAEEQEIANKKRAEEANRKAQSAAQSKARREAERIARDVARAEQKAKAKAKAEAAAKAKADAEAAERVRGAINVLLGFVGIFGVIVVVITLLKRVLRHAVMDDESAIKYKPVGTVDQDGDEDNDETDDGRLGSMESGMTKSKDPISSNKPSKTPKAPKAPRPPKPLGKPGRNEGQHDNNGEKPRQINSPSFSRHTEDITIDFGIDLDAENFDGDVDDEIDIDFDSMGFSSFPDSTSSKPFSTKSESTYTPMESGISLSSGGISLQPPVGMGRIAGLAGLAGGLSTKKTSPQIHSNPLHATTRASPASSIIPTFGGSGIDKGIVMNAPISGFSPSRSHNAREASFTLTHAQSIPQLALPPEENRLGKGKPIVKKDENIEDDMWLQELGVEQTLGSTSTFPQTYLGLSSTPSGSTSTSSTVHVHEFNNFGGSGGSVFKGFSEISKQSPSDANSKAMPAKAKPMTQVDARVTQSAPSTAAIAAPQRLSALPVMAVSLSKPQQSQSSADVDLNFDLEEINFDGLTIGRAGNASLNNSQSSSSSESLPVQVKASKQSSSADVFGFDFGAEEWEAPTEASRLPPTIVAGSESTLYLDASDFGTGESTINSGTLLRNDVRNVNVQNQTAELGFDLDWD